MLSHSILRLQKHICCGIRFTRETIAFPVSLEIIACTCFGAKFGENNIRSQVLLEISLTYVMCNFSGREILLYPRCKYCHGTGTQQENSALKDRETRLPTSKHLYARSRGVAV